VLGLSATVSGKPYELTAETLDPCRVSFVKREDFLRFLKDQTEACFKVAEQLSEKYNHTCREMRSRGLSHSAGEKLARLEWGAKNGEASKQEPQVKTITDPRRDRTENWDLARDGYTLVCKVEETTDRAVER
jgi:hypothetical protein